MQDGIFVRIFEFLPLHSLKNARRVSRRWYNLSLSNKLLRASTCFVVDGRIHDQNGSRFQSYVEQESRFGLRLWSFLRIHKCTFDQLSWISRRVTSTITHVEFSNCSISWFNVLRILFEFENLISFSDVQDM